MSAQKSAPQDPSVRIMVAEDDDAIRQLLVDYLRQAQYTVLAAADGQEALETFLSHAPALVVLDVAMPQLDGWDVLREIRRVSDTPVLMLTARSQEKDQLTGFGLGADDYVAKPFSLKQVAARIEALLRRSGVAQSRVITVGPIELNPASHSVRLAGRALNLTGREYALLEFLMRNPDRVFSRAQLLMRCWEPDYNGVDRVVDVHIASLRRKLGRHRRLLTTVRGEGYKLSPA